MDRYDRNAPRHVRLPWRDRSLDRKPATAKPLPSLAEYTAAQEAARRAEREAAGLPDPATRAPSWFADYICMRSSRADEDFIQRFYQRAQEGDPLAVAYLRAAYAWAFDL